VKDAQIESATAQERDVADTILTAGTVTLEDDRTGHVLSPVTGRVVEILAPLGGRVKVGDGLAVIESPDIGNALSDVHKAEADVIAAEHDLKRKKELFEEKAAPASDLDTSEDAYRRAQAELERAHQKEYLLRVGNADAVTQRYTLRSPVDGEVLLRNISPGVEVQGQYAGGTSPELFTIGELDRVWVLGQLFEMDLARVHVGAVVSVSVVAYPGVAFQGQVDWVSGELDPTTRTSTVRCTFENPDRALRPMMYATMQISVDQKRVLAIPREAVLRVGESKIVFVELDKEATTRRFRRVAVDVDEAESSPWLEVKNGLTAGESVVVSGSILLLASL
jgi:cobalt-zinc-cadmium efflux system membrane fusion protein